MANSATVLAYARHRPANSVRTCVGARPPITTDTAMSAGDDGPRSFTRLEDTTRSDDQEATTPGLKPGWHANAYPDAGEAVAYWVSPPSDHPSGSWSTLTDDERAEENAKRTVRRAKGEMRRYMVTNSLRYMWVLHVGW